MAGRIDPASDMEGGKGARGRLRTPQDPESVALDGHGPVKTRNAGPVDDRATLDQQVDPGRHSRSNGIVIL
jgi:hypothetical protein